MRKLKNRPCKGAVWVRSSSYDDGIWRSFSFERTFSPGRNEASARANMKQSLRDYEALALLARSEAHTGVSVSRRLASQDEIFLHF